MILLDTTVLVYAVGADHPLRAPATQLIAAIGAGDLAATTTVEVIQEFTHVRARRRSRDDAATLASDLVTLLTPLTTIAPDDLTAGLDLFARSRTLGCFDAVLGAVARRRSLPLVTADRTLLDELPEAIDLRDAPVRLLDAP